MENVPTMPLGRAKSQNKKEPRAFARKSGQCHPIQLHQHNAPLRVLLDIGEY